MRRAGMIVVLCVTGGLLPAGALASAPNGIQSKSPDEAVSAALAAGSTARSAWVHGSGVNGGGRLAVDIHIGVHSGRGHLLVSGLSFDFIRLASTVYFRGDVTFWRKVDPSHASLAPLFAGKWMKVSGRKNVLGPFASFTELPVFLHALLTSHGALASGGLTTYSGQSVLAVRDTSDNSTLYVAATGKPYPVALAKQSGSSHGTIRFDAWDRPLTVTAPRSPIDISRFVKK